MLLGYFSHLLELSNLHLLLTLLCLSEVIKTDNLLPVVLHQVAWLLRGHPGVGHTTVALVGRGTWRNYHLLRNTNVVDARRLF